MDQVLQVSKDSQEPISTQSWRRKSSGWSWGNGRKREVSKWSQMNVIKDEIELGF
jgi:hypothetical protein